MAEFMRSPCVEAGLIPPLVQLLNCKDQEVLLQTGRALGNICYDSRKSPTPAAVACMRNHFRVSSKISRITGELNNSEGCVHLMIKRVKLGPWSFCASFRSVCLRHQISHTRSLTFSQLLCYYIRVLLTFPSNFCHCTLAN